MSAPNRKKPSLNHDEANRPTTLFDIHTCLSITVLLVFMGIYPLIGALPDLPTDFARHWFILGVSQSIIIRLAPCLLWIDLLRRWFGWRDACNGRPFHFEKQHWHIADTRSTPGGYLQSVRPYLYRYVFVLVGITILDGLLPFLLEEGLVRQWFAMLFFYPAGIVVLICISIMISAFAGSEN